MGKSGFCAQFAIVLDFYFFKQCVVAVWKMEAISLRNNEGNTKKKKERGDRQKTKEEKKCVYIKDIREIKSLSNEIK